MKKLSNINELDVVCCQHLTLIKRIHDLELDCLTSRDINEISLNSQLIARLERDLLVLEVMLEKTSSLRTKLDYLFN